MKTSQSLHENNASANLIFYILGFILLLGYGKDDDSDDKISNDFGTYMLMSISSGSLLDHYVYEEFSDDGLIDNISSSSSILLNTYNSFTWDVLSINQNSSDFVAIINSYDPVRCCFASDVAGEFIINGNEIEADSLIINTTIASINENIIEIIISPKLTVSDVPLFDKNRANLILTYES